MTGPFPQSEVDAAVVQELRDLAAKGASVRQLFSILQGRLGLKDDAVIPTLSYFMRSFSLSLPEVLPIREWLGSQEDREIDAVILPAIERSRAKWSA